MKTIEQENKELRAELKQIKSIQPEDNLRYLVRNFELDKIKVDEKDRVLNILNEVNKGIKNLTFKADFKKKSNANKIKGLIINYRAENSSLSFDEWDLNDLIKKIQSI